MILSLSNLRLLLLLIAGLWSTGSVASVSFSVCYDFGCRSSTEVTLSAAQWKTVSDLFDARDAREERSLLRLAIGHMEFLAGIYTPTYRDIARNLPTSVKGSAGLFPGQLDCIDESINTSRYLELFESNGLMRFHQFTKRVYRRSVLTQHWAAAVEETATGEEYVVDSWFTDNGGAPIVVLKTRWQDLSRF